MRLKEITADPKTVVIARPPDAASVGVPKGAKSAVLKPDRVIDPAILASYAGTYQIAPSFGVKIRVRGGHLVAQAGEQPEVEPVPASDSEFTCSKAR